MFCSSILLTTLIISSRVSVSTLGEGSSLAPTFKMHEQPLPQCGATRENHGWDSHDVRQNPGLEQTEEKRWSNFCGRWMDIASTFRFPLWKSVKPVPLCEVVFASAVAAGIVSSKVDEELPAAKFNRTIWFCAPASPRSAADQRIICFQRATVRVNSYEKAQQVCANGFSDLLTSTRGKTPQRPLEGGYLATMPSRAENAAAERACREDVCWIGLRETPAAQNSVDREQWAWERRGSSGARNSTSSWEVLNVSSWKNWRLGEPDDSWGGREEDVAVLNWIGPIACFWIHGNHRGPIIAIYTLGIFLPCFFIGMYFAVWACCSGVRRKCQPRIEITSYVAAQTAAAREVMGGRSKDAKLSGFYGVLLEPSTSNAALESSAISSPEDRSTLDAIVDRLIRRGARAAILFAFFMLLLAVCTIVQGMVLANGKNFGVIGLFFFLDACCSLAACFCKFQVGLCAHKVHNHLSALARGVAGNWVKILAWSKFFMAGMAFVLAVTFLSLAFSNFESGQMWCNLLFLLICNGGLSFCAQTTAAFSLFRIHEGVMAYVSGGKRSVYHISPESPIPNNRSAKKTFARITRVWWRTLIVGTYLVGFGAGLSGSFMFGPYFDHVGVALLVAAVAQVMAGVAMLKLNTNVKKFFASEEGKALVRGIEQELAGEEGGGGGPSGGAGEGGVGPSGGGAPEAVGAASES